MVKKIMAWYFKDKEDFKTRQKIRISPISPHIFKFLLNSVTVRLSDEETFGLFTTFPLNFSDPNEKS